MFWYLAQTKPRQEGLALTNLERQGYLVKLPRVKSLRRVAKAKSSSQFRFQPQPQPQPQKVYADATQVLFPGYIFFAPNQPEQSIAPVRSTLGIGRVVRFGIEPAKISAQLLDDILAFVEQTEQGSGGADGPSEIKLFKGPRYLFEDGPFSGLSGLVSSVASDRVMVLLEIMGKAQTLGFDLDQLDKA